MSRPVKNPRCGTCTYFKTPECNLSNNQDILEATDAACPHYHALKDRLAVKKRFQKIVDEAERKEREEEQFDSETLREGEKLLEDPALLHRIHNAQGDVQGEDANKVLLPLLNFGKQSFEIEGETAAGKNTVADSTLSLFPKHWWDKITGLSDKAVRYLGETLRTLYLAERRTAKTGEESTAEYDIKLVISEGKLKVLVTIPDPEDPKRFKTDKIETAIENIILTSTELIIPEQLQNRIWVTRVDESKEQNIKVRNAKLEDAEKLPSEKPDFTKEKKIIRAAFSIADKEAPKEVIVPYATLLKSLLDEKETRVRRDTDKLVALIKNIARLFYRQRAVIINGANKQVLVSAPQDFWIAWRIGSTAIRETFTDMTERDVRILKWCKEIAKDGTEISTKTLAELTGKSDHACWQYLRALQLKGFLVEISKGPHGLKIYSLQKSDRHQVDSQSISISEMKIKYENRLKAQNDRLTRREVPVVLIDPITGERIETLSLPPQPIILTKNGENTLDSNQKTGARLTVNLDQPDNVAEPPKPPPEPVPLPFPEDQHEDWKAGYPDFFVGSKQPLKKRHGTIDVCYTCWMAPKNKYQQMLQTGTIRMEPLKPTGEYVCQLCGKEPAGYRVIV